ncbi:unnamed protein product [Anisakis simplex]|uniref:KOW domain-containing protein n=1 Tax=Anisakis simplex TaxID=6269 RepID=A0A3P6P1T2_ANISI|nr:unnamed protein product [Anisakis simplex]
MKAIILVEGTKVKERLYTFAPGDYVEVADGELVNLRGRVQSVDGEKVVVLPDHEELKRKLYSFLSLELKSISVEIVER